MGYDDVVGSRASLVELMRGGLVLGSAVKTDDEFVRRLLEIESLIE